MPLDWLDVSRIPFDAMTLLERIQLSWLVPPSDDERFRSLAIALQHNPAVAWCIRNKCPEIAGQIEELMALDTGPQNPGEVRRHELKFLDSIQDWLIYVLDPARYDALPFQGWDSNEFLNLTDFRGKRVIDIGAGTGRLAFTVSPIARLVYACEPIGRLRDFIRKKAERLKQGNLYVIDGLMTKIPMPDDTFDVAMCAHVFGDEMEDEYQEMERVTRRGGMIILCPGNNDRDNDRHDFLTELGFDWSRFEEPDEGTKRKYWLTLPV
jgi:SAM-dependent methyltransferase